MASAVDEIIGVVGSGRLQRLQRVINAELQAHRAALEAPHLSSLSITIRFRGSETRSVQVSIETMPPGQRSPSDAQNR